MNLAIEGRQAVPLLVLRDLGVDVVGVRTDDNRDRLETGVLCSTEALRAEQDLVAAVDANVAHDDRLKDAVQGDVLREFGDLLIGNSVRGFAGSSSTSSTGTRRGTPPARRSSSDSGVEDADALAAALAVAPSAFATSSGRLASSTRSS
jgi:hypothetical protein